MSNNQETIYKALESIEDTNNKLMAIASMIQGNAIQTQGLINELISTPIGPSLSDQVLSALEDQDFLSDYPAPGIHIVQLDGKTSYKNFLKGLGL